MRFEEKKQEIIQNITKIQHNIHKYSKSIISLTLEHLVIYELKELQPDNPTCSTCKYYSDNKIVFDENKQFKCKNINVAIIASNFTCMPTFGCIYHDKA